MTITFENDNDVIVYAFEKVIAYARRTQQIFVANCVWWLASIIGLEQGLINHIDNLQSRAQVTTAALPEDISCIEGDRNTEIFRDLRGVSVTPRDIQEDPRSRATSDIVHPDRRARIQISDDDISSLDIEDSRQENIVKETEKFSSLSQKKCKAVTRQNPNNLLRNRSGKIIKSITKKQRNYLQSISKEAITDYIKNWK
jgi:phosphate starvation-inducible protein PhoH